MRKTAVVLMVITIVSKALGLLRDLVLSNFYGASTTSDAYLVSITITSVLFGFVVTGIATSYIPMYRSIEKNFSKARAVLFTSNLAGLLTVLATIITILGMVFTEQLVKLFASGFEGGTFKLAVVFTRICLFNLYFTGLIGLYSGFLQLQGNYIIPALIGLPLNIVTIIFIYLSTTINIFWLGIGTVLATVSQFLLLVPFILKKKYKHRFRFDIKDEHIKKTIQIALPVIFGVSINEINVVVDRTIASQITPGGISALYYANLLNNFVLGVFVVSISSIMYPQVSKMAAERDMLGFKKMVRNAVTGINFLVLPAAVGLMVLSEPLVKLLFGRGEFDSRAISMTASALFFSSIGLIGFSLREIVSRAFYALQDTKTPAINAAIAVVLNIILNIVLSRYMGIDGLALATSISAIICLILLLISLQKKIGSYGINNIIISFIKVLFSSVIMGIVVKFIYKYLDHFMGDKSTLLISIIIGVIVYAISVYILKIKEINYSMKMINNKVKKSRD
ncbi:murein biosynthesis integral membrane protein MurJ [Bacillus sp. ISL-4]|nr:murein biosynthesis integral membrane protein MurJ [Bacillus sp. ISL-4]MBT2672975.1 murein biosynthesis integral membrane protein MurJ [Streptomyces sp. ISL-14]